MINNSSSLSVLAGLLAVALSKSMGSKSSLLSNIDDTITIDFPVMFVTDEETELHVRDMRSDWAEKNNRSFVSHDTEELWNEIIDYVQQTYESISDDIRSFIDGANVIIKELRKNRVTFRDAFKYNRLADYYGTSRWILEPVAIKPEVLNVKGKSVIQEYEEELHYAENDYHERLLANWNFFYSLIESIEVLSMEMADENITEGIFDIKGYFRFTFNTKHLLKSADQESFAISGNKAMNNYLESVIEVFLWDSKAFRVNEIFVDGKIKYQPMSKITSLLFKKNESDLRKF